MALPVFSLPLFNANRLATKTALDAEMNRIIGQLYPLNADAAAEAVALFQALWDEIDAALGTLPSLVTEVTIEATAGQTLFTAPEYPVPFPFSVQVFLNGSRVPFSAAGWKIPAAFLLAETATQIELAVAASEDDEVIIIVNPLTRAELASVAWVSITGNPFKTIADFGAVGDNVTNDSAAFEAADLAQVTGECGPVFIPLGTYYCPETSYAPTGNYYGIGRIRFGGDGTFTDNLTYAAPSVPSPIYAPLHADGRRGLNLMIGPGVMPLIDRLVDKFNTAAGDRSGSMAVSANRSTLFGAWAGAFTDRLEYADIFGASAGQYLFGNRTLLIGNNAGKWMGSQDPVAQKHDFWNLGADVDDPGDDEPKVWSNKDFEAIMPFVRSLYLDGTIATVYTNPEAPAAGEIVSMGNVKSTLIATSTDDVRGNVAGGRDALIHMLKGINNSAIGYKSMAQAIDANRTTAVGRSSGEMGLWHVDDVFVGAAAGYRAISTSESTVIGARALRNVYSFSGTVAIGNEAGAYIPQSPIADKDTFNLGRAVLIGSKAAANALSATNAIVIGYRAGDNAAIDLNNRIFIGSGSSSDTIPTIGGELGSRSVAINRDASLGIHAKLYVNEGAALVWGSGITPNTAARIAVFEASTAGGITIATPNDANGNIFFADPDDNNAGGIQYRHATDELVLRAGDDWRVTVKTNTINLGSIPTSTSGLVSGDVWSDGGTLKVVT